MNERWEWAVEHLDAQPTERSGLSRREIIKRSAIAGGVVWTAPVILDSMLSPAGAASPTGGYPCSYITVVYKVGDNVFAVKFNKNAGVCDGTNTTSGDENFSTTCNGVTYSNTCSGTAICANPPPPNGVGPGGAVIPGDPSCSSRVFYAGGNTISAAAGVTIIFAASHDGSYQPPSKFKLICPINPQSGNSVTSQVCSA